MGHKAHRPQLHAQVGRDGRDTVKWVGRGMTRAAQSAVSAVGVDDRPDVTSIGGASGAQRQLLAGLFPGRTVPSGATAAEIVVVPGSEAGSAGGNVDAPPLDYA